MEALENRRLMAADFFHFEDIAGDSAGMAPGQVFQTKWDVDLSFDNFTLGAFNSFNLAEVAPGPPTSLFPAAVNPTQTLTLNNINAHFDYRNLATEDAVYVEFDWVDHGGDENFNINGIGGWEGEIDAIPPIYPGFQVESRLACDLNADGVCDVADIDLLSDSIASGAPSIVFDINSDSSVDSADIDAFLVVVGALTGDSNLDGTVNFPDFLNVSGAFGGPGSWSNCDFNQDGIVSFPDFLELSLNFGNSGDAPVRVGRTQIEALPGNRIETVLVGGQEFAIDNVKKRVVDRPVARFPDLVVADLGTPAEATIGEAIGNQIQLVVRNEGNAPIPSGSSIGIYLSPDATITTSDSLLVGGREFLTTSLAPGDTMNVAIASSAAIPGDATVGTQFIGVVLDEANVIGESDESNNTFANRITINAPVTRPPDIEVVSFSAPPEAFAGSTVGPQVRFEIRNNGGAIPNGTDVSYGVYLSNDRRIDASDRLLLGGREFFSDGLGAGQSRSFNFPVAEVQNDAALGSQFIGVWVDEGNAVAESDETNNTAAAPIDILLEFTIDPKDPLDPVDPLDPFDPPTIPIDPVLPPIDPIDPVLPPIDPLDPLNPIDPIGPFPGGPVIPLFPAPPLGVPEIDAAFAG